MPWVMIRGRGWICFIAYVREWLSADVQGSRSTPNISQTDRDRDSREWPGIQFLFLGQETLVGSLGSNGFVTVWRMVREDCQRLGFRLEGCWGLT